MNREDEALAWIVESRNRIQVLMLDLHRVHAKVKKEDDWFFLLGASFSLWRAVFLVRPADTRRTRADIRKTARNFLKRVIETNSIQFADDFRENVWSCGYYLNNARLRLGLSGWIEYETPLRETWDETFATLQKRLAALQ